MVGIDTLKLRLTDFTVSRTSPLFIQPAPFRMDDENPHRNKNVEVELFQDDDGKVHRGSNAYLNTPFFHFDIMPKRVKKGHQVFAFVRLSVPKYAEESKKSYQPVTWEKFQETIAKLNQNLSAYGIETNLLDSKVSRIDLYRNVNTDRRFTEYGELFHTINASRKQRKEFGGEGFLWKNKSEEFCIYDKLREMGFSDNSNVMRIEQRCMSSRVSENRLGTNELRDVLQDQGEVESAYKKHVEKNVFRTKPHDKIFSINSESLAVTLRYFERRHGRNYLSYFLKYCGLIWLKENFEINSMVQAVKDACAEKSKVSRFVRELDQVLEFGGGADNPLGRFEREKICRFYDELFKKVIQS